MNKIALEENLDAGLTCEEIIRKFLSQMFDKSRLDKVVIKEYTRLPLPITVIDVYTTCTQTEINELISFSKDYVTYKRSFKTVDGFRQHLKLEMYDIEYNDNKEDTLFKSEIRFRTINQSGLNGSYAEYAKNIIVAERNLNDAKWALDNVGVMF